MDLSHLGVALISAFAGAIWMRKRMLAGSAPSRTAVDHSTDFGLTGARRVFFIVFLTGWLIGWTIVIILVAGTLLTAVPGAHSIFLLGWLIAALAAWGGALHELVQAVRGKRSTVLGRKRM